jgi:hypothetical protein
LGDRHFPSLFLGPPHRHDNLVGDIRRRRRKLLAGRRNPRLRRTDVANPELGRQALVGMLLADPIAGIGRPARPDRALVRTARIGPRRAIADMRRSALPTIVRVDRAARPHRALARILGPIPRSGRPVAHMRRSARQALVGIRRIGLRPARQALVRVAAARTARPRQTLIRVAALAERNDDSVKRSRHGEFSFREGEQSLARPRDARKTARRLIFE